MKCWLSIVSAICLYETWNKLIIMKRIINSNSNFCEQLEVSVSFSLFFLNFDLDQFFISITKNQILRLDCWRLEFKILHYSTRQFFNKLKWRCCKVGAYHGIMGYKMWVHFREQKSVLVRDLKKPKVMLWEAPVQ